MHKRLGEIDRNLTKEGIRKEKKDTQGGWEKDQKRKRERLGRRMRILQETRRDRQGREEREQESGRKRIRETGREAGTGRD